LRRNDFFFEASCADIDFWFNKDATTLMFFVQKIALTMMLSQQSCTESEQRSRQKADISRRKILQTQISAFKISQTQSFLSTKLYRHRFSCQKSCTHTFFVSRKQAPTKNFGPGSRHRQRLFCQKICTVGRQRFILKKPAPERFFPKISAPIRYPTTMPTQIFVDNRCEDTVYFVTKVAPTRTFSPKKLRRFNFVLFCKAAPTPVFSPHNCTVSDSEVRIVAPTYFFLFEGLHPQRSFCRKSCTDKFLIQE